MTDRREPPLGRFLAAYLPDGLAIERAPPQSGARATLYLLLACCAAAFIWAAWAEVDVSAAAPGRLVTTAPTVVAQPLETAVILSLEAAPGDRVPAGRRLARLDPTFAAADLAELKARLAAAQARRARLEAEKDDVDGVAAAGTGAESDGPEAQVQSAILAGRRAEYAARLNAFDSRRAAKEAEIDAGRAAREGIERRIAVAREIEAIREELHRRNTGSLLQLLDARRETLRLEDEAEALRRRETDAGHELRTLAAERAAFRDEWRRKALEEFADATRECAALVEQIAKATRRASLVELTAPVDAVVLEVARRSVGSVAQAAEPLFTLIPADAPLEMEAELDGADVGAAREGDPVRIKLDAFPFQKYGAAQGRLRMVSPDSFQPKEPGRPPTYRVRVELTTQAPFGDGPAVRLTPGMTGTAEILTGRRTVLSYLTYPILRGLDESARER
jgi:hemolysin D